MRETAEQWMARLSTRAGILAEITAGPGFAYSLPDTPARRLLKREGLIESFRTEGISKHHGSAWRLTAAGKAAMK